MILLDTNILIYLLNSDTKTIDFLEKFDEEFAISVISYIEVMIGREKEGFSKDQMKEHLSSFSLLPITINEASNVLEALDNKKSSLRKVHLQDYFIGATAVANDIPLVTNNGKDFKVFSKLKLIELK